MRRDDDEITCPRCGRLVPELSYVCHAGPVCAECEPECRLGDEALEQEWIDEGHLCPDCRESWDRESGCTNLQHIAHHVIES